MRLIAEQAISTVTPLTAYSISDMEQAMRKMQVGSHLGKMVLVPRSGDQVQIALRPRPVRLSSDATYLIAGWCTEQNWTKHSLVDG